MIRVYKPYRLWRLSGRKHIQNWIRDRETARPGHDLDQRPRKELLKLAGFVLASGFGFLYSYGCFSPEKYLATVIRPDRGGDNTGAIQPCPSDKQPNKPRSK